MSSRSTRGSRERAACARSQASMSPTSSFATTSWESRFPKSHTRPGSRSEGCRTASFATRTRTMTGPDGLDLEVKRLPGVTVVVMAYNEVDNLAPVVAEILAALRGIEPGIGDILIVDDGSTDGTAELADRIGAADGDVRVVHHGANQGLGQVYWTGLTQAEREFVTFFPADGQFPASILPDLFALARDGDLVLGYLPRRRDSIVGRLLSWGQRLLYRALVGPIPRFQGVLMVRRSILGGLQLQPSGRAASIVFEMIIKIVRAGYRVVSVPTAYRPRVTGHS